MAKRQKRLEGASLKQSLPDLIGKNINIVEKNGTARKVILQDFREDRLKVITLRNNAKKKENFNIKIEDIAEIILDYPDNMDLPKQ